MSEWDVVLVGGARFGTGPPLGDFQLARALGETRRVLYVDPPHFLHSLDRQRRPWTGVREHDGVQVLSTIAPPFADRHQGRRVGDAVLGWQISRSASAQLREQPVVITFEPRRGTLPQLPRRALVYWVRDRLDASPVLRHRENFLDRHATLMQEADLVTAVSPTLADHLENASGRQPHVVLNGCDVAHFTTDRPAVDLPHPRPVIGYAGGLSWRVDTGLLAALADARPDWTFLLVGEVMADLPVRPNIVSVGAQSYDELPSWLAAFDVGLIPYVADSFNAASFPLKALEYLACGLPVVSTPLPSLDVLGESVAVAATPEDAVRAIERALEGHDPRRARARAEEHSWRSRADQLVGLVEGTEVARG